MDHHPYRVRIGSVCTGYGGLDDAVRQVFGGDLAWVSDIDPGACQIIAHRMPGVPNLGDLKTTRWEDVEPVDIYIGGYPCQPFSLAGGLKGTDDDRHLWPDIARALRVLRPRIAIFENVANHLRLGFDTVLCDLADLGFDAEWVVVRADEVGAPHQRRRLFLLATAANAPHLGHEWRRGARRRGPGSADHSVSAADSPSLGRGEGGAEPAWQQGRPGVALCSGAAPADACGNGLHGHGELPAGRDTVRAGVRTDADGRRTRTAANAHGSGRGPEQHDVPAREPDASWGRFAPAIARWEAVTGRRAPRVAA